MVFRNSGLRAKAEQLIERIDPNAAARSYFMDGLKTATGSHEYDPMLGRRDFGLMPWEDSAKKYGISELPEKASLPNKAAYGAGRIAGTIATDNARSWWWRWNHPLAIAKEAGSHIPRVAGLVNKEGKPQVLPAVLGGFALATALDATTGNTDYTNLMEGGRPKGYSAVLPTPEDATRSENMAVEIPLGYVTGRKGKLLPWDKFTQERPDVSPEQYAQYKDYQSWGKPGLFGIDELNPVGTAALGAGIGAATSKLKGGRVSKGAIVGGVMGALTPMVANVVSRTGMIKGTFNNLDGEPEAQLLGYKVPLSGLIGAGVAATGIYAASKSLADRQRGGRLSESSKNAKITLEQGLERVKALDRTQAYQREIDVLDPHVRNRFKDAIQELEAEAEFQEQGEEFKARMMKDRIARERRRMEIHGKPPDLTPEQEAQVAKVVADYRERKNLK